MDSLSEWFGYDATARNLKTRKLLNQSHSANRNINDIASLLRLLAGEILRCDETHLYRELAEWGRFRSLFVLLPEQLLYGSPPLEEKPVIRQHLDSLGVKPTPDLVSAIKCLCINFRSKKASSRKLGITDVYIKYPHIYDQLVAQQRGRCFYCGILLIYGENAALDHLWPFYLGDDPHDGSNWCLACNSCNSGKGEYPFYSLTSVSANWIGPTADGALTLAARFAALSRDRACVDCGNAPDTAELTVRKRVVSGCWILDNIVTVCKQPCSLNEDTPP